MLTVSSCVPYGLVTLQMYWVLSWSTDTGLKGKVSERLFELTTVMPSLIHSTATTSKSEEHMIDILWPTVSGILMGLIWRPAWREVHVMQIHVKEYYLAKRRGTMMVSRGYNQQSTSTCTTNMEWTAEVRTLHFWAQKRWNTLLHLYQIAGDVLHGNENSLLQLWGWTFPMDISTTKCSVKK